MTQSQTKPTNRMALLEKAASRFKENVPTSGRRPVQIWTTGCVYPVGSAKWVVLTGALDSGGKRADGSTEWAAVWKCAVKPARGVKPIPGVVRQPKVEYTELDPTVYNVIRPFLNHWAPGSDMPVEEGMEMISEIGEALKALGEQSEDNPNPPVVFTDALTKEVGHIMERTPETTYRGVGGLSSPSAGSDDPLEGIIA